MPASGPIDTTRAAKMDTIVYTTTCLDAVHAVGLDGFEVAVVHELLRLATATELGAERAGEVAAADLAALVTVSRRGTTTCKASEGL